MTAQLIIYLDTEGNPHCELPGRNGMRQTVALPCDFAFRNPEIMATLRVEDKIERAANAKVAEANRIADEKRQAESARIAQLTNAEIAAKRAAAWQAAYDSATPEKQAIMMAKKVAAKAHQDELNAARAKGLWQGIASPHGIKLANRVIDKKRRPNKRISTSNGGTYNPRTEKRYDSNGKRIRELGERFTKRDTTGGKVIDIKL
jgi:hypothetical protein